jgi:hypothetical protein
MTTPAPAVGTPLAGVTTGSFGGSAFPPQVVAAIVNLVITGAPFSASLTRFTTTRREVTWPTASPSGYSWLAELEQFPDVSMADGAYTAVVCKIGGIVDLSNEAITDSSVNLSAALAVTLQDSLSRSLDLGLLNGTGTPPQPVGVIGIAPSAIGPDLLSQVTAAKGSIGDAGGTPDTLAISATSLATEDAKLSTAGGLAYPNGFAAAMGLTPVVVPALSTPLVYDSARCFLVVRTDNTVDWSRDYHFQFDATSVRVKARVAAGIPDPNKSIRKCSVTMAQTAGTGTQQASTGKRAG